MQILTNAPVGSAEWKARRTGKLSASRVADALGHGRRTPLELWMELTGKVEPEDIGDKPWVIAGQRLESVVADWYADETGRVLQDSPGLIQDARLPFLVGTPDRLIPAQDQNPPGVLEIKTTNAFNRAAWETDNPPIDYQIQLQTYLRLTGCEWGSLACLIGGQEFVQRDQAIDPVFQEWLEEEITRFWELVQSDTPPDPRAKEADLRALAKLHPDDDGSVLNMTEEQERLVLELYAAKDELKECEEHVLGLEARVKAMLKASTWARGATINLSCKTQVSEKKPQPARTDKYRVLRKVKEVGS